MKVPYLTLSSLLVCRYGGRYSGIKMSIYAVSLYLQWRVYCACPGTSHDAGWLQRGLGANGRRRALKCGAQKGHSQEWWRSAAQWIPHLWNQDRRQLGKPRGKWTLYISFPSGRSYKVRDRAWYKAHHLECTRWIRKFTSNLAFASFIKDRVCMIEKICHPFSVVYWFWWSLY